MLPIIDTHQHLWDLSKLSLAWLPKEGSLSKSHTLADYWRDAEGLNIVKTVYMEVDSKERDTEADLVLEYCRDKTSKMAGAVIGGDPASANFAQYIEKYAVNPEVKGVRQVLHGGQPRGYCLEPKFVDGVKLLGKHGLRFDLCLRPDEITDGAKLAAMCPETQFVLDHCGNAPVFGDRTEWDRGIVEIAERPNVICKISGIVAQCKPNEWKPSDLAPIVYRCREVFGIDRLMYASDHPVCTIAASLREWTTALQTITADWTEPERRQLFYDNAKLFYKLSGTAESGYGWLRRGESLWRESEK